MAVEHGTMPRRPRITPRGLGDHVLKRGVARLALFETDEDDAAFERVMTEAIEKHPRAFFPTA